MRGPGCWLLPLPPPLSALLGASAARTRRRWDLSREAETHAAAGGSAGPSRPAQPEVSVRRRGGGVEAAGGRGGGAGASPGTEAGAALRETPSPFSAVAAVRGGRRAGQGARVPAGAWRAARAGSLPPPRRFFLSCCCPSAGKRRLRASRPSPRQAPGESDGVPGGAESEDSGGLLLSVTCPLAWAGPLPRHDAASSLQAWGVFRPARRAVPPASGEPFGMRPARGASVPTHPDAVSSAGIGAEAAVPCGRVAVLCVLHPAHVVGCLPPSPLHFLQLVRREVYAVVFPL